MLGLIGKHLYDHKKKIAHTEINYTTSEKINLQPWDVTIDIPPTAKGPARQIFIRAATQDDFKAFIKQAGENNGVVGELPEDVAKEKEMMYKECIEKRNAKQEKITDKK